MFMKWAVSNDIALQRAPHLLLSKGLFDSLNWRPIGWYDSRRDLPWQKMGLTQTEDKKSWNMALALPEVDVKDLQVSIHDQIIQIRGTQGRASGDNSTKCSHRTMNVCEFRHDVQLPHEVMTDHVKAVYQNQQLLITVPKQEGVAGGRVIPIQGQTDESWPSWKVLWDSLTRKVRSLFST